MNTTTAALRRELHLFALAFGLAAMPLFALTAAGQSEYRTTFTEPAQIDRAVEDFTGAAIGETGGARMPADRRLRLASCEGPLDLDWHGSSRSTVRVACPGPTPWRIFVALRAAESGQPEAVQVARGDPITVVVRGRGFSVQQGGEALEAGRIGDWIAIRTAREAAPVRAQIERPGLAVIPAY